MTDFTKLNNRAMDSIMTLLGIQEEISKIDNRIAQAIEHEKGILKEIDKLVEDIHFQLQRLHGNLFISNEAEAYINLLYSMIDRLKTTIKVLKDIRNKGE